MQNIKAKLFNASPELQRKIINAVPECRASGGRVGFAQGTGEGLTCVINALEKDTKGTLSKVVQAVPETRGAIMETLGPDGWRFLDVDYTPTEGLISRALGSATAKLPKPAATVAGKIGRGIKTVGRFVFDPLDIGLIPLALMGEGTYQYYNNLELLEKQLATNPNILKMAERFNMPVGDVRKAIKEKYRRAALGAETGVEETMAFEPKFQKEVKDFEEGFKGKGFLPKDYESAQKEEFGWGIGAMGIAERREKEEAEYERRLKQKGPIKQYLKEGIPEAEGLEKYDMLIPYEDLRKEEEEFLPYASGGRVGLKKGTFKPGRRLFIKGVGASMLVPFLGKFFKFVGKKGTSKVAGPIIQKTAGMPDWFPGLVKRLYQEGDDVTGKLATKDLQVVKGAKLESGDDIHLYHDIDTGGIRVEVTPAKTKTGYGYETESGAYHKGYGAEVKKGETVVNKKGQATKTKDEFSVVEEEHVGGPEDVDFDLRETTVDDALSDLTEMEAFAKKKSTKQIHKKKGTTKKEVWPEFDDTIPEEDEFLP